MEGQTVLTGINYMEKALIVNNDGPWDLSAMRKERKQDWGGVNTYCQERSVGSLSYEKGDGAGLGRSKHVLSTMEASGISQL